MPQSDGTKVRRAKKRHIPLGLVAVQAKKEFIANVMKDFQAKGEWQAAMEGFVPGAAVFFVEATPEFLSTNIPKHSLAPYCFVMAVEEWAANSMAAHEFSYAVWAAGEAKDATAPRLWSSMVGTKTELGMEWSAAIYLGTNKLQVGVNGQHNADTMESGIVAMAQQLGLLIKRPGVRAPLGDGEGDDPMCNGSASSTGVWKLFM